MRLLVVGAGGVGSSIVSIAARRPVFEQIVVADVDPNRSGRAAAHTGKDHVIATRVDASDRIDLVDLARSARADVVVNACDPRFNPPIFDAASVSISCCSAHWASSRTRSVHSPTRSASSRSETADSSRAIGVFSFV